MLRARGRVRGPKGVPRAHLWRTLTMPSSRCVPQREAGVMPGKLKLGSFAQPASPSKLLLGATPKTQTIATLQHCLQASS